MTFGESKAQTEARFSRIFLSVLVHGTVVGLLILAGRTYIAPMLMPGDANGTRMTLTYLPGRAPQAATSPAPDAKTVPVDTTAAKVADTRSTAQEPILQSTRVLDVQKTVASLPNSSSTESANPNSNTGADSLGTGNINIAYLDSFRSPRPDLSSLPRGVSGDVVLDVTIDTAGRIIALKKLSGVGYGIDESVIATVQAWVFHPATRDGNPVVSEQELHFHYEHRNG